MLLHQHGQVKLGDRLELEDKHLHHLHKEVTPVGILLLAPGFDAFHKVKQEFARHGLQTKSSQSDRKKELDIMI